VIETEYRETVQLPLFNHTFNSIQGDAAL